MTEGARNRNRLILWAGTGLLYLVFLAWYTNLSGPLEAGEIDDMLARLDAAGVDGQRRDRIHEFMRSDTGRDFIMINLLDLNETPPDLPATGPGAAPDALIDHYMEHMYPAQLARASHPVFFGRAAGDALDIQGIEGAAHWEQGALFRYRSRRDLMEIATDPRFGERHEYKLGALSKTIAYPVEPVLNPGDVRIMLLLLLFSVASLLDLLCFRRRGTG